MTQSVTVTVTFYCDVVKCGCYECVIGNDVEEERVRLLSSGWRTVPGDGQPRHICPRHKPEVTE